MTEENKRENIKNELDRASKAQCFWGRTFKFHLSKPKKSKLVRPQGSKRLFIYIPSEIYPFNK